MNYADIKKVDVANGPGVRVSLYSEKALIADHSIWRIFPHPAELKLNIPPLYKIGKQHKKNGQR